MKILSSFTHPLFVLQLNTKDDILKNNG